MKLILPLLILMTLLSAQQEIRGAVLQGSEKYPPVVDNATVVIKWGVWTDSTHSDEEGFYSIESPATGRHYIRAYKRINNEFWDSGWKEVWLKYKNWKWVQLRLEKVQKNSFELKECGFSPDPASISDGARGKAGP
jgi:hypothetical protein